MIIAEFQDKMQFAVNAINQKNGKGITVKVIINFKDHANVLDIREVGFDDKTATIFIEA